MSVRGSASVRVRVSASVSVSVRVRVRVKAGCACAFECACACMMCSFHGRIYNITFTTMHFKYFIKKIIINEKYNYFENPSVKITKIGVMYAHGTSRRTKPMVLHTRWAYTRGGRTHEVGVHTKWAYTRGGRTHEVGVHARWAYTRGGRTRRGYRISSHYKNIFIFHEQCLLPFNLND